LRRWSACTGAAGRSPPNGAGLIPPTSAPGLGAPLADICSGNGRASPTSAPAIGAPLRRHTSAPIYRSGQTSHRSGRASRRVRLPISGGSARSLLSLRCRTVSRTFHGAKSRRRCGRGEPKSICLPIYDRAGPSPGADVGRIGGRNGERSSGGGTMSPSSGGSDSRRLWSARNTWHWTNLRSLRGNAAAKSRRRRGHPAAATRALH
jgi:hypothetical protein